MRNRVFCLKRPKRFQLSIVYCFSLKFCVCFLLSNAYKKVLKNCIFSKSVDLKETKENRTSKKQQQQQQQKKIHTQVFNYCYV